MNLPENLLLIDKPKGYTSFDVIRQLRRQTNVRKIGHAGTLDPCATGLLVLGFNQGTKQLNSLIKLNKQYIADIFIGAKTNTSDQDGYILETKKRISKLKFKACY